MKHVCIRLFLVPLCCRLSDGSALYEWVINDLLESGNSITAVLTSATTVCVCNGRGLRI